MIAIDDEVKEKLYKVQDMVDNILYQLEDAPELHDAEDFGDNIRYWKKSVLDTIPEGCSLKFRKDVEALLENFKNIY